MRSLVGRPALRLVGSIRGATTAEPVVALTFDDGPTAGGTEVVLDLLRRFGARATFFVLADRVEQHPEVAIRVRAEGHEIALHGADHRRLTKASRKGSRRLRPSRSGAGRGGDRDTGPPVPAAVRPAQSVVLLCRRAPVWDASRRVDARSSGLA